MGLAPYITINMHELLMGKLIKVADDGSFQLNTRVILIMQLA